MFPLAKALQPRSEARGLDATRIGIAVVERHGEYLVGFRTAGQVLAGHAEFPGGKCEAGEESNDCTVRECREETGLVVRAVEKLEQTLFEYDHGRVELNFWLCHPIDEKATPTGNFRWIRVSELRDLPFPDGNDAVIRRLQIRSDIGESHDLP
mgnify:CR=1 FL=1